MQVLKSWELYFILIYLVISVRGMMFHYYDVMAAWLLWAIYGVVKLAKKHSK